MVAPSPKYSAYTPAGKPLKNELEEFFKVTKADKKLPKNKEKNEHS